MSEPMTVERAREISKGFILTSDKDTTVRQMAEHFIAKGFLEAHALLSSENEKLAGMVKKMQDGLDRAAALQAETIIDGKDKDDEIASLRADLKRTAGTLRREYEHCAEGAAEVDVLEAALTHHREAANVLVGALEDIAADKEFSHTPDGNGGQKFVRKVWYAEFASRALSKFAALTAPQAPEEGKS